MLASPAILPRQDMTFKYLVLWLSHRVTYGACDVKKAKSQVLYARMPLGKISEPTRWSNTRPALTTVQP